MEPIPELTQGEIELAIIRRKAPDGTNCNREGKPMTPNRRLCPLDSDRCVTPPTDYAKAPDRVPDYWTDYFRRHWLDIGTIVLCGFALACCVGLIWLSLLVIANWEWLR